MIFLKENPLVQQELNHLPWQSYAAYREFLDKLRRGKKIGGVEGENLAPNRPERHPHKLPTGDWIIYSVNHKRIWRLEFTEITVERLIPQNIVALIHPYPDRRLKNFLQQLPGFCISIADNSQRLIFAVQLGAKLVPILLAIGATTLMLLPQFTYGLLGEKNQQLPLKSEPIPEDRDQFAGAEGNRNH